MASLLLALKVTGLSGSLYLRVAKNWAIHKAFFLAFVVAIYLALVKERVTIICCFDWCNTSLIESKKAYPPVDYCPSLSLAQLNFVYLTNSFVVSNLNVISNYKLSAKYWKIWVIKVQYIGLGFV